ncbi:MAG: hypothetical protein JEZ04_12445 [Spirochaetales bacterium]|nr:hypothetical protein [Spirochaetales bacterium]
MDIRFSSQGTGACPLCKYYKGCKILKKMKQVFLEEVKALNDNALEAVIYRCPHFEEE